MTTSETTPRTQPRSGARPWAERSLPITERVELLLSRMTLTEKVAQLGSHWDDLRGGDEIIAPMQDVLSSGRRPFEQAAGNGIGHLTRVLGTRPASAATGGRAAGTGAALPRLPHPVGNPGDRPRGVPNGIHDVGRHGLPDGSGLGRDL